ncbi:MAG: hypothetical protein OXP74_02750 [Acidobacteriota bacterium]|nr:hypothetical protein [Acidobacteriota bacterium]
MRRVTRILPKAALGFAVTIMALAATTAQPPIPGQTTGLEWCGVDSHDGPASSANEASRSESRLSLERANPDELYEITILFFYTHQFADEFRGREHMDGEIRGSVGLLNLALENSHVNARFRIAGIERHPAMSNRQHRALSWIVEDERAKRRRDELAADLVYALVDDPAAPVGIACEPGSFTSTTGEFCFWGSVNTYVDFRHPAFGNEVWWQTILRHEVGHNLGIQHSPRFGGRPNGGFYPGAVGYSSNLPIGDPGFYGTVLGGNEIPRFSTSSERFDYKERQNLIVGRRGVHEASTALLYSIGPVSNYRPRTPETGYTDCEPTSAQIRFSHGYEVSACVEYEESGKTVAMDALDYGLDSEQSGLLYFFDRDNAEVLIKVLDACAVNGHRWVFVAPVTDLALNLEVREIATGKRWQYRNPRGGQTARPRSDTAAFPCDATAASWAMGDEQRGRRPSGGADWAAAGAAEQVTEREVVRIGLPAHSDGEAGCEPDAPALTLRGGYTISMCYVTPKGEVGNAVDWELDSEQSALLYFFDRDNVEVLLKVLDGCGVNGHHWVFVAPVTDLAFNLIVESPEAQLWTHTNELGRTADAASDVSAFPCSRQGGL